MKLLTQTIALGMALIFTAGTFAQSPTSATRQRKATTGDASQTTSEAKPTNDPRNGRRRGRR